MQVRTVTHESVSSSKQDFICHGVRNVAKKPGTVLDTQGRICWEGVDGFSLKIPITCNISSQLL